MKVIGSSLQHHLSVTRCVGVLFDVVRSMYPLYTWPNNGHMEQVLHSASFNHPCCFTLGRSTVNIHDVESHSLLSSSILFPFS